MMQLAILESDKPHIWLVQSRYIIGKGRGCDIRLDDETLREEHLCLDVDGDMVTLAVAEATVAVNGSTAQVNQKLVHDDELQLGRTRLKLVDPKQAARATVAEAEEEGGWRLQGLSSALSNKYYDINGTVMLGRASSCDISLGVAHLSRQHARLTPGPKGLLVEDLGSANGTYVNGERVERTLLKTGDELKLDTLRFRVLAPGVDCDPDQTSLRPAVVSPTPKHTPKPAVPAAARATPTVPRATPVAAPVTESAATQDQQGQSIVWLLAAFVALAVLVVTWYLVF